MAVTSRVDFAGFPDEAFDFYEELAGNNSRSWWLAHKGTYEQAVRAPMAALLDQLAPVFKAEPSMFRPNRDIRFSKDKSPYKTHQGGFLSLAPGVGYYLSVDADGITVGGGFHAHDRAQTARFREAVDRDTSGEELEAIVTKVERKGFQIGGEQVRTRPRGVPADHPRLELMRREYVSAGRHVDPADAATAAFVAAVRQHWRVLTPLVEWVVRNAPPTA